MKIALSMMIGLLLAAATASGGPEDVDPGCPAHPDKSAYNLFHPVPAELLRDLDTDRPDKATSPRTVDAGHLQVESDFLRFTSTKEPGIRGENWGWGSTDFRIGVTNWADLQFYIPFYQSNRVTDTATNRTESHSGIGDLTLIFKTNFWGNDTDGSAGGAAFFLKTPTASHGLGNGKVEGGVLFLIEAKTFLDFDLTFNTGVGIDASEGGGYQADLINVINLTHDIVGPVSGYVEFFSLVPANHGSDWSGTIDLGFLVKVGKNLQFDLGMNIGVTQASEDLEPFVGITYRF